MARTDNDSWDLASSVGATATMVAAARAVASRGPDAVIDDRFAEPLVRAVGVDFFTRLASGELDPAELTPEGEDSTMDMRRFADGMAARTRFFDGFFADAGEAGVRQAVILASGLDARAYRLSWPAGTVVYEIDQPEVIEFKTRTMAGLGAQPTADRRAVAIDLRQDWVAALGAAGFDPARPTAWIAEGLMGYLPPQAQDQLLDQICALSAPGSRLAVESVPGIGNIDDEDARRRMQQMSDRLREHGLDLHFGDLVFTGERADVAEYLRDRGWSTTEADSNALLSRYGLEQLTAADRFGRVVYVAATK